MSRRYGCRSCRTQQLKVNGEGLCHACDPHSIPFRAATPTDALVDGVWVNDRGIQRWVPNGGAL